MTRSRITGWWRGKKNARTLPCSSPSRRDSHTAEQNAVDVYCHRDGVRSRAGSCGCWVRKSRPTHSRVGSALASLLVLQTSSNAGHHPPLPPRLRTVLIKQVLDCHCVLNSSSPAPLGLLDVACVSHPWSVLCPSTPLPFISPHRSHHST